MCHKSQEQLFTPPILLFIYSVCLLASLVAAAINLWEIATQ